MQQPQNYPPPAPNPPNQQYPYGPMYGGGAMQPPMYRQNAIVPPGATSAPLLGPGLRKTKLALGIVQVTTMLGAFGFFIGSMATGGPDHDAGSALMIVAAGLFMVWYLALIAYGIINLVWTYKFWSWIPPEHRYTSMWKTYISPGMAIGLMFIPYFNLYWMFVVFLGIADILERMRVAHPTPRPSAKNLALMRLIVPFVFFPAGPFLDYFFDKHVEGMAADMQAQMPAPTGGF